jgi:hypothetical protein
MITIRIDIIENLQDPYFLKTWRERNLYLSR